MLSKFAQSFSRSKLVFNASSTSRSIDAFVSKAKLPQRSNHRSSGLSIVESYISADADKKIASNNIFVHNKCISTRQYSIRAHGSDESDQSNQVCTFPYAESCFPYLITRPNVFYIDKTNYIPKLEKSGRAIVLLAPKRFGKSLFLDTLATYYDISRKDQFQQDFGQLWIANNTTQLANKFHVHRIDFSKIAQSDNFINFNDSLNRLLNLEIATFCAIKMNLMENAFNHFFSTLKFHIGSGHVRAFIAGVSPLVLGQHTAGFNIGVYPQLLPGFADLFGMTINDVNNGLSRIEMPHNYQQAILEYMISYHNGYRFHERIRHTLFNPNTVQFFLVAIQDFLEVEPSTSLEALIDGLRSLKDPNTSPAESALRMVSSNPLSTKIVTNCLNLEDGIATQGITHQFKLSDLVKSDTLGEDAVLSWMFFTGALAYEHKIGPTSRLKIPNLTARIEYLEALKRSVELDETTITQLQYAIIDMIQTQDTIQLKSCLENHLLHLLQGRDVLDQEQAIQKLLLALLTICKRPMDRVYSEYKVDPVDRAANQPGCPVVDIVYQTFDRLLDGSFAKKRFVFELKNIPISHLQGKTQIKSWEKQVEASNQVREMADKELKQMKYKLDSSGEQTSIQSLIDDTVTRKLAPYMKQMQKDAITEGDCIGFVVVRVGLLKLMTEKLPT